MAMRECSRCSNNCSLRCNASFATSHKQVAIAARQAVKSRAWNQPVCQKKILMGRTVGMTLIRCGMIDQGSPPAGDLTIAADQSAVGAVAIFFQFLIIVPSVSAPLESASLPRRDCNGIIFQLASDLISIWRPSA